VLVKVRMCVRRCELETHQESTAGVQVVCEDVDVLRQVRDFPLQGLPQPPPKVIVLLSRWQRWVVAMVRIDSKRECTVVSRTRETSAALRLKLARLLARASSLRWTMPSLSAEHRRSVRAHA
jgi:hypothetical protein